MIQKNNKFSFSSVIIFVLLGNVLADCPTGYFKLKSMRYCFPWLGCKDIKSIEVTNLVGYGSTKNVYRAVWRGFNVTYSVLRNRFLKDDFYRGLYNMKILRNEVNVVQLLGFCESMDVIITEFHQLNNALHFDYLREQFSLKERFRLCYSYVQIIYFLHNSPIGTLVNCDSNDLPKLLSQLLLTNENNLILADLDALPDVRVNSSVICGKKEIKSNFVAPEQLWSKPNVFQTNLMEGYDEKTDIWKIPDVCAFFVGKKYQEMLQYFVFEINLQCKLRNPQKRPTAKKVLDTYLEVLLAL